jgi:hypothetical protein
MVCTVDQSAGVDDRCDGRGLPGPESARVDGVRQDLRQVGLGGRATGETGPLDREGDSLRRVIILCSVLLLMLATAAPAAAGKYREAWEDDFDDTWYVLTCPQGFDIYDRGIGHESFQGWYDKDGNPSIGLYQNKGTDNVFNEEALAP